MKKTENHVAQWCETYILYSKFLMDYPIHMKFVDFTLLSYFEMENSFNSYQIRYYYINFNPKSI